MNTTATGVRPERTGWRDLKLSMRHRDWGPQLVAVDIDFLMIEYIDSRACAIVEYKHEFASMPYLGHPSFRVLSDFYRKDGSQIPAFCVRYGKDFGWFDVSPLNESAKRYQDGVEVMSEHDYVALLYRLRGRKLPPSVAMQLRTTVSVEVPR